MNAVAAHTAEVSTNGGIAGKLVAIELVMALSLSVMIMVFAAVRSSGHMLAMWWKKISCVLVSFRSWIRKATGRTGLGSKSVARDRRTDK